MKRKSIRIFPPLPEGGEAEDGNIIQMPAPSSADAPIQPSGREPEWRRHWENSVAS